MLALRRDRQNLSRSQVEQWSEFNGPHAVVEDLSWAQLITIVVIVAFGILLLL